MAATKWSGDAFLDGLRQHADPLADEAVRQLWAEHESNVPVRVAAARRLA